MARSLLVPGAQPPLCHFGATLLRHVAGTVVRYSLYQLGLPMPESPPVRIVRLRVYLDAEPLEALLGGRPGGAEVLAAIVRPDGAGTLDRDAGRMRAAVALHRLRLAMLGPRHGRAGAEGGRAGAGRGSGTAAGRDSASLGFADAGDAGGAGEDGIASRRADRGELWAEVGATLAGRMPYLCDAALGELVAAMSRRRRRLAGQRVAPALGQVAWQAHRAIECDLRALGPLDPRAPSWEEAGVAPGELRARAARALAGSALPRRPGRRGSFREAYRWVLSEVRPRLLALGERALEEGIVEAADDVFFIPFDLGSELTAGRRPSWLAAAVGANRREHEALRRGPEPADRIDVAPALAPLRDRAADWEVAPLVPVE